MYKLMCIAAVSVMIAFLPGGIDKAWSSSVTVGPEVTIYSSAKGVDSAALTCNTQSGEYLVVWEDDMTLSSGLYNIKAQLLKSDGSAQGSVIDIAVSQGVMPPSTRGYPDVAYSSKQDKYCIVYVEDSQAVVEILASDGTSEYSSSIPRTPGNDHSFPAVVYNSNADEFLVVWDHYIGSTGSDIESMRITRSASGYSLTGTEVNIATGWDTGGDGIDRSSPDAAYNADRNEYLIVYTYGDPSSNADIYGKIVPADLSGALSKNEIIFENNTDNQRDVSVAAGNDEYLVVWEEFPSSNYIRISGRRLNGDSTLPGSSFVIGDVDKTCSNPKIAYSPRNGFIIAFDYSSNIQGNYVVNTKGNYVLSGTDSPVYTTPFNISADAVTKDIACQESDECFEVHSQIFASGYGGVVLTVDSASSTTTSTGNTAPTASFSVNPTVGDTATAFLLEPFASSDAEDPLAVLTVRIDWETDGTWDDTVMADVDASHQYGADGTYTITIEVEDTGGLTDQATQQVKVLSQSSGNTDPTASFTVDPSSGDTSTTFSFDASECSDAEDAANSLEVMWDFDGDGVWDTTFNTTKTATHKYTAGGTYDVELVVTDSGGLFATAVRQVVVSATESSGDGSNTDPNAVANVFPPEGPVDIEFEFNFEESTDAEDAPEQLQGRWDFESDGQWDTDYSTEKFVLHTFDHPDVYLVTLEVQDSGGLTAQDTIEVLVTEAGGCALDELLNNDPESIAALKKLRDDKLAGSRLGRRIIRTYYRLSPTVAKLLESSPQLKAAAGKCLQFFLAD